MKDKFYYTDFNAKTGSLNDKKKNYKIRVTTFLTSSVKDDYIDDCIDRKLTESQVARHIMDIYYKIIIPQIPNNKEMEFVEIKKYLSDNIKL